MKIKNIAEFCRINNITDGDYLKYFDEYIGVQELLEFQ